MAINWTAIEDAIHAWVVAGSGLTAAKVIWSQQNAPQPAAPYIALRLRDPRQIGQDWLVVEDSDDLTPPVGEEIVHHSRGQRTIVLSMQAFGTAATGTSAPVMMLDAVRSAVNLPTRRQALNDAGLGIGPFDSVLSLDGSIGEGFFQPRGSLDVTLMLSSEVTEYATYIETVEATNEITTPDTVITLP